MSKGKFWALSFAATLAITAPLVVAHEGNILRTYKDPVGIPTACAGVTKGIAAGQLFTQEECQRLNRAALLEHAAIIARHVRVELPEQTHAALISFVYNVGESNFKRSTLLKKLNKGDLKGACNELPRWVYAKGRKLPGLVRRRTEEKALCLEGTE